MFWGERQRETKKTRVLDSRLLIHCISPNSMESIKPSSYMFLPEIANSMSRKNIYFLKKRHLPVSPPKKTRIKQAATNYFYPQICFSKMGTRRPMLYSPYGIFPFLTCVLGYHQASLFFSLELNGPLIGHCPNLTLYPLCACAGENDSIFKKAPMGCICRARRITTSREEGR